VLDRNVWLAGAELDLVVRRGRSLVFVEVKSKAGDRHGDPLEMVTPAKVARLRRAALAWLAEHREAGGLDVRFDVVAVRSGRIEQVPGAF
jgi:putative endonuclease